MKRKRTIQYSLIIIGVILLLYTLCMALVMNFNAGFVIVGLFALAVLLYGVLWERLKKAKWLHAAALALCVIIVGFMGFLSFYGSNNNVTYDEDVVIVLGAGIRGEQVTPILAYRLDRAVEYHAQNPDALIIVSGGQGPQEDITEALAMERYLIERGIPAAQIIKEEESTSTFENFAFSRVILEEEFAEGYSAAFITNNFHVYRAERIAAAAGISASHMGAHIKWYGVPITYSREILAVIQLWLFPPS
ncbi:MAG: YdcF family protein [Coriobacteriia bacterium]|nr:YdcF family protein [Coriobacteriia bacterium]MCL2750343.1 YdcF family protein [Coriobacteriia bacterium]